MEVVGVDGTRGGWLAIYLSAGRFAGVHLSPEFRPLVQAFPQDSVIAVRIPIGLPTRGRRLADLAARRVLSSRRNSVFLVPPRHVLEAPKFQGAVEIARGLESSASQQIYALRHKILEVNDLASDSRIVGVHPEVSFWALNEYRPLNYGKGTWNGLMMRLQLLREVGVELPPRIDAIDKVSPDDMIDAAAAAWSASRIARGEARSLPEQPETDSKGRPMAIWY